VPCALLPTCHRSILAYTCPLYSKYYFVLTLVHQPLSGKSFPGRDIGTAWHTFNKLIINNLFFGIWLEITIPTTRSAKRSRRTGAGSLEARVMEKEADCTAVGAWGILTLIVIT